MIPQQCTKLQNGQKGMTIPILPNLVWLPHPQRCQDKLIHLADASSHGVVDRQIRSLSSRLPSIIHGSSAKVNHPKVVHSTSNQTRIYKRSLASATSADVQATRHRSVGLSHSKLAEVTSLMARQRNPPSDSTTDSITREMNERAARED